MQRIATLVGVAVVVTFALPPTNALADGPVCQRRSSQGICTVWVQTGGHGGSDHGGSSSGSGKCVLDVLGVEKQVPCTWRGMPFSRSLQCYVSVAKPQPPKSDPIWNGRSDGAVYNCRLPGSDGGIRSKLVWSGTTLIGPDSEALAQSALKSLTIPAPTTGRYPAGKLDDGTPYTLVGAYTWFWTSPASFGALSASASAGGVTVQVQVRPQALMFTSGDGASTVSCAGPGSQWSPADGVWAASPSGCDYRYPHSSIDESGQVVTATYGIRWGITWSASTGQSGILPDLTTTARSTFAVAEAEAVVIK